MSIGALLLGALVGAACGADERRDPFEARPEISPLAEAGPPADTSAATSASPVDVVVTADNGYSFGWGTASAVTSYFANESAVLAEEIFSCPIGLGPEAYEVPAQDAEEGAYLYIVAWADLATTQGVIGTFNRRGGEPIFTGSGGWEACATGKDHSNASLGPPKEEVNEEIAKCNAGSGDRTTTSAGWVGPDGPLTANAVGHVAFGQSNESDDDLRGTPGFAFPPVCKRDLSHGGLGMHSMARWMWYAPDVKDPFWATGKNDTRMFLIFRLASRLLPPPKVN